MIRILKVAVPTMIQQFVSLSVWFVFFLFVEKLGKSSLAVSNIIRSIYLILMIPIWGYATASNTLVSYLMISLLSWIYLKTNRWKAHKI